VAVWFSNYVPFIVAAKLRSRKKSRLTFFAVGNGRRYCTYRTSVLAHAVALRASSLHPRPGLRIAQTTVKRSQCSILGFGRRDFSVDAYYTLAPTRCRTRQFQLCTLWALINSRI
jgi:hypothetical protein